MTTAAQTKHAASPDKLRRARPLIPWLTRYLHSSVGGKHLVALTGAVLVGFVIVHMAGNLQILLGREAFNHYAHTLEASPALVWTVRLVLLAAFALHVYLALRLAVRNRAARPSRYAFEDTAQASWASRHMVLTGLLLFAFVVYHLLHYTAGVTQRAPNGENLRNLLDDKGRRDAYQMVIYGFSNPFVTAAYVAAMAVLALHLSHGTRSLFQSLGVNSRPVNPLLHAFSRAVTIGVVAGFTAVPVAVYAGLVE
jgi:succinate dehydrogenase cytochrome b subunit